MMKLNHNADELRSLLEGPSPSRFTEMKARRSHHRFGFSSPK